MWQDWYDLIDLGFIGVFLDSRNRWKTIFVGDTWYGWNSKWMRGIDWLIQKIWIGRILSNERSVCEKWARFCSCLFDHFTSNVQWFERFLRSNYARQRYRNSRTYSEKKDEWKKTIHWNSSRVNHPWFLSGTKVIWKMNALLAEK